MVIERFFVILFSLLLIGIVSWEVINLAEGYEMIKAIFPQITFGAFFTL